MLIVVREGEVRHAHCRKRVQVQGTRRVWGTVKATTSMAVKTSLKQLSTIGEDVLVKRKCKTAGDGSNK